MRGRPTSQLPASQRPPPVGDCSGVNRRGAEGSLCDTCRDPGRCCRGFSLTGDHPRESWRVSAEALLVRHGLSGFMRALWQFERSHDPEGPRVHVWFACDRLGHDGRCLDYEHRPQLCRDYQPGQDGICAEHVPPGFKGIPIVVLQ